ncbi:hypothetical protein FOPE_00437 [Fonsecaea pedrosoi]|nr:hypothetical protein FOPE_00437 [Fonsecaea pedrosoi]
MSSGRPAALHASAKTSRALSKPSLTSKTNFPTKTEGHSLDIRSCVSSRVERVRPLRKTAFTPALAKDRAVAAPMPDPDPVMKTVLLVSSAFFSRSCKTGYVSLWNVEVKFFLVMMAMLDWIDCNGPWDSRMRTTSLGLHSTSGQEPYPPVNAREIKPRP